MNTQYHRIFQKLCGSTLKCCHHVTSFLGRRHGLPMVTPCRRMAARSWSPILVASPPANSPVWQRLGQDLINHGTLFLGIWGIENMVMIVNHLHPLLLAAELFVGSEVQWLIISSGSDETSIKHGGNLWKLIQAQGGHRRTRLSMPIKRVKHTIANNDH